MKMKEMLKNAIIDALNSHKLDEMKGLWKGVSYDSSVSGRDKI